MKLLSHVSRKYNDKEYEKYWIIVPSRIVEKLGWKKGEKLEAEIKGDKLIIERD